MYIMFFNWALFGVFIMLSLNCFSRKVCGYGLRTLSMKKKNSPSSKNDNYVDSVMKRLIPKTPNQILYSKALSNKSNHLLVVNGPAGSGKTHFVCDSAVAKLMNGVIDKIIVTRPTISVDNEELGYLPGTVNSKMNPWMKPIFDVFLNYYTQRDIERMIMDDIIEVVPIAHMRGRTFKRAYIIADEMQNSSPIQMKMLLTRIGDDSKMVITGDLSQTDSKQKTNGFAEFINKYDAYVRHKPADHLAMVELTHDDVFRSEVVKTVLNIYDFDEEDQIVDVAADIDALDSQSSNGIDTKDSSCCDQTESCDSDCCISDENSDNCSGETLVGQPPIVHTSSTSDAAMIPKSQISKRLKWELDEDGNI